MHRTANYFKARLPANAGKLVVESYTVTKDEAATVRLFLLQDASDYYYSACMSIADGLRAIDIGFHTWSTVKMYYSVFYSLRSILAWEGTSFFYICKKPYFITLAAGSHPTQVTEEGSHKSLIKCFQNIKPDHYLFSQPIEYTSGPIWLLRKRENANYKIARFAEPEIQHHYAMIDKIGVRKATTEYFGNSYLDFDHEHAIVSYPIAALRCAGTSARARGGAAISHDELDFLLAKSKERNGVLSPLLTFVNSTLQPL